jgi:frataxin
MDESAFQAAAESMLTRLYTVIDETLGDDVDAELRGGILTLEFEDGRQYVINKHAPTKQLWLSSPVSGAAHFGYDEATRSWRSTRGGPPLIERLAAELAAATGRDIAFD